jgi:hypothetical protein
MAKGAGRSSPSFLQDPFGLVHVCAEKVGEPILVADRLKRAGLRIGPVLWDRWRLFRREHP